MSFWYYSKALDEWDSLEVIKLGHAVDIDWKCLMSRILKS